MTAERWKPVPGWPYDVSDLGRVRRSVPGRGTSCGVLALNDCHAGGYLTVVLSRRGRQRRHYVHRLVAVAFIGAIPVGYEVNHLDGDKRNNRPGNLEIVTKAENHAHGYRDRTESPRGRHRPREAHPARHHRHPHRPERRCQL